MIDFATARTTMVDCQVRPSDVTKYPIIEALLAIPREEFVPEQRKAVAYSGAHLDLGAGRVLLDARTFAKMLEAANIQPDEMVLDLGCGLGYSSAIIAHMAEAVICVEENEELAAEATNILAANSVDNAVVITAPLTEGAPKHGPYDVIITEGAVEDIPDALLSQIKEGGRIVTIVVQGNRGDCMVGFKHGDQIDWRRSFAATAPVLAGFEKKPEFKFN